MTGIVVGLGGNPCSTGRGMSLKHLIRSGERSSEVKVTLCNRGKEAYRPEVYGNAIVVERVISSDGAGSYKIKNARGELWNILHEKRSAVDVDKKSDHYLAISNSTGG